MLSAALFRSAWLGMRMSSGVGAQAGGDGRSEGEESSPEYQLVIRCGAVFECCCLAQL